MIVLCVDTHAYNFKCYRHKQVKKEICNQTRNTEVVFDVRTNMADEFKILINSSKNFKGICKTQI